MSNREVFVFVFFLLLYFFSGVMQATKYKDRCLQVTLLQINTQGSEDCLYLNIFVPQGRKRGSHSNAPRTLILFKADTSSRLSLHLPNSVQQPCGDGLPVRRGLPAGGIQRRGNPGRLPVRREGDGGQGRSHRGHGQLQGGNAGLPEQRRSANARSAKPADDRRCVCAWCDAVCWWLRCFSTCWCFPRMHVIRTQSATGLITDACLAKLHGDPLT